MLLLDDSGNARKVRANWYTWNPTQVDPFLISDLIE